MRQKKRPARINRKPLRRRIRGNNNACKLKTREQPCSYANFCRVTGTPEELIVDFGLNTQPFGVPVEPVQITQRIVTNYYTAKRMLHALHLSVQRHEQAFGVLETDVQKRVVAKPQAQG